MISVNGSPIKPEMTRKMILPTGLYVERVPRGIKVTGEDFANLDRPIRPMGS